MAQDKTIQKANCRVGCLVPLHMSRRCRQLEEVEALSRCCHNSHPAHDFVCVLLLHHGATLQCIPDWSWQEKSNRWNTLLLCPWNHLALYDTDGHNLLLNFLKNSSQDAWGGQLLRRIFRHERRATSLSEWCCWSASWCSKAWPWSIIHSCEQPLRLHRNSLLRPISTASSLHSKRGDREDSICQRSCTRFTEHLCKASG